MLGSYRLVLAMAVALSHAGFMVGSLNPGVVAVVGFYLVSGYVMTGLLRNYYAGVARIPNFYLDRALRLFPHYLAIAVITLVWFEWTGTRTEYLTVEPGAAQLLQNLLVVPLNYYMFNHSSDFTLVPPAWSLGAEIQFYLVIPFVLLLGAAGRKFVMLLSATIYTCATLNLINSDWYGFRLLPGILFVFLLGSWLYDLHHQPARRLNGTTLTICATIAAALLATVLFRNQVLTLPYNRETLLGLVIGTALVNALAHRTRHRIDDALGNVSYGVFLNHYLVMWVFFDSRVVGLAGALAYLVIAVTIATAMYLLVERPVLDFRHRVRARRVAPAADALVVAP